MKKKLYLIVISFFLLSGITYAQDQSSSDVPVKKPTFWWGLKVGADLLTPTLDQGAIQSQIKSNYQVGFFLQFGRKFYIQPEFYYATQIEPGIISTAPDVTINTVKVPIMLGMRLFNLKVISAHLMAGPAASFLLKDSSPTSNRKQSNFALQAGGGIDLIGLFTLDVRYSFDTTSNLINQFSWDNGVNVTFGIKFR